MNTLKQKWLWSFISLLGVAMLTSAGNTLAAGEGGKLSPSIPGIKAPYNPKPFQNFLASPSAPVRFLLSEQGKSLLRQSAKGQQLLKSLGEDISTEGVTPGVLPPLPDWPSADPRLPVTVTFDFSPSYGSLFNLEPRAKAQPQNEQSVDFLPTTVVGTDILVGGSNDYRVFGGLVGSRTGYYVKRATTATSGGTPDFEGGLPAVPDPLQPGDTLEGGGAPVIAADPARNAVFAADLRFDDSTTAIGVFRTTAANLIDTTTCPNGTHTAAQSAACWPMWTTVGALPVYPAYFNDKPHLAVDEVSGNVYVSWTEFNFSKSYSRIMVVKCNNSLAVCGSPVVVSNLDTETQFSHLSVIPGSSNSSSRVTVSWINVKSAASLTDGGQMFDIKFNDCISNPPAAWLGCNSPRLVHTETRPLPFDGFLGAQDFLIATYPKHDHVVVPPSTGGTATTRTVVVWDRCKVDRIHGEHYAPLFIYFGTAGNVCVDADVVMKQSANGGSTWDPVAAFIPVNISTQDQFFPWIKTDRSRNIVNIVYYSSQNDPTFQHRVQVFLNHLTATFPLAVQDTHVLTSLLNDPSGDPFLGGSLFGDYIGVAARGASGSSRAYTHFTFNNIQGTYNGIPAPEQNNHMSRLTY